MNTQNNTVTGTGTAQCIHNTMTERKTLDGYAWECAECGYIYGVTGERTAARDEVLGGPAPLEVNLYGALGRMAECDAQEVRELIAELDRVRQERDELLREIRVSTLRFNEVIDEKIEKLVAALKERDNKQKQLNATFLQLSEAEQERDELLAAIRRTRRIMVGGSEAAYELDAAIAKAEGRAE